MKKSLLTLSLLFTFNSIFSECVLVPLSLKERTDAAQVIVEAYVGPKVSYWNGDRTMIHTSSELKISKIYKGASLIQSAEINLITLGGRVGNQAVKVEPELEIEEGEIGIFMLVMKNSEWVSESGPQGFIRIDKFSARASDVFNTWPPFTIAGEIQNLTGFKPVDINSALTGIRISSKRAAPVISSISPKTITAGTSTVLTITGSNFGNIRDTNTVQFRNGDDGGLSFVKGMKHDYVSWSDTVIKLIVRSKAGTGKIRVVAGANGMVVSADTLKITYSHLNVVSGDSLGFETQEIGMNNLNGITWKMNKRFYDSSGARGAFMRSLERWRCGTFINWDTLGRVNHSSIKLDGTNMCAWDTNFNMPNGVLAQCFSYYAGCFTTSFNFFVNELDIRFRMKPTSTTNWNFTTGNASSNQFHFESVATHELGHGHQLGHVINSALVMHYAISNGQTKPNLNASDIAGGAYVINKSTTAVCGKKAHTKLNAGNCPIVAPKAEFRLSDTVVCKNDNLLISDTSAGNISAYAWNFGSGATPATANTKGPHTVKYSTGGTKTISLTITTIAGNLVKTRNVLVQNDTRMISNFSFTAAEKGNVSFTNLSNNPSSNIWYFGDGDSSLLPAPSHKYNSGGTYAVKLLSTNTCNTNDSIKNIKFAWLNFGSNKDTACILEPVAFIDSSDNSVSSWAWTFNGGIPATANGKGPHLVKFTAAGSKQVTLQITSAGAPSQTYTQNGILTVGTDTFSKASFKYGYYGKNIVGFENLSEGSGLSYKWYFGDGDSSIEKHPVHTYSNANNKTVKLMISGDCGYDDTTIQLPDFTGIHELEGVSFELFPNPAAGFTQIKTNYPGKFEYRIYDLCGKLLFSELPKYPGRIELSNLPQGIYMIQIQTETAQIINLLLLKE